MKKQRIIVLLLLVFFSSMEMYAQCVSVFPYTESFETGLGDWENNLTDDFDWTNISGSTPSINTGPSAAADGSYYIYTDATTNWNELAILDDICFDFSSQSSVDMSFQYHMYGVATGTLSLEISTDDWTNSSTLFTLSGDQGNLWKTANIDLSAYAGNNNVKLRFKVITGASSTSDIAIDDISISTCVTPAEPTISLVAPTGLSTANLSWSAGTPSGSAIISYYWSVGTSPTHTFTSGYAARGNTTGTSVTASGLSCGTTYYLRLYAQTSCDASMSTTVTSSAFTTYTPTAPNSVSATPSTVCPGGTAQLNATSLGNTIRWYTVATGGTDIGSSASGVDFPITTNVTTTYFAETESSFGCASINRIPVTVYVYDSFVSGAIDVSGQSICYGDNPSTIGNITSASGGNGNITYCWRSSADNYTYEIAGATSSTYTPPAGLATTTTYRRYAKDNYCITSPIVSTGIYQVTVKPLPVVSSANASPVSICLGESSNLSASSVGYVINWYTDASGGTYLGSSTSGDDFEVKPLANSTYYAEAVEPNQNIANLATVSHSAGGASSYGPELYNDGFITIYGSGVFGWTKTNGWIEYTWPTEQLITAVKFYKEDRPLTACTFQYWDGTAYVDFYSYNSSEIDDYVDFGPIYSTKIRFYNIIGANPNFREIEVYGAFGCSSSSRIPVSVAVTSPATDSLESSDYIWSGAISTEWNNPNNWLSFDGTDFDIASTVPTSSNNVYINRYGTTCAANIATVSAASAYVKNFTIDTNKSVIMSNSQVLNVSGDWTNAGSFDPGDAKVVFNGSALQTIINKGGAFNDVTFDNSADFNLGDTLTINGDAVFNNGIISYVNTFDSTELNSLDVGTQTTIFTSSNTRGYHFIAPVNMKITSLMVPTSVGASYPQCIQVIKYQSTVPIYPESAPFTTLFYVKETTATTSPISCNIEISAGEEIAIIGARYNGTNMYNSYGPSLYSSSIDGNPITLTRVVYQASLSGGAAISGVGSSPTLETSSSIGRVEMEYMVGPSGSINFGTSATSTVSSNNSFVNGKVSKTGSTDFTFPIGDVVSRDIAKATQTYKVLGAISLQPAASTTVSAEYCFDTIDMPDWWEHGGNMDATLHHVSGREHWLVSSPENITQATLKWYDNAHAVGSTCLHGFDEGDSADFSSADLTIAYWDGSMWVDAGGTATGNHDAGNITSASIVPFVSSKGTETVKFITFGSKNDINPLPIELLYFKGVCDNGFISLNWETASELNNDYFIVEKSSDLLSWETVGKVQGAGNSSQQLEYFFSDENNGSTYYRLTQVDYDGKYEAFDVINVVCNDNLKTTEYSLSIYPNPTDNYVYLSKVVEYELLTLDGKLIKKGFDDNFNMEGLAAGVYMLRVANNDTYKIVKR